MEIQSLEDLFKTKLQALYSIEQQLIETLPVMAENATSDALKTSLTDHLEVTKTQTKRLETIAEMMDVELSGLNDEAMQSLLAQEQDMLEQITDSEIKDTAIMGGATKVEHYEMACYSSAITLAKKLDQNDIADILDESYDEEKNAARMIESMASGGLMKTVAEALS